ncbi:hypothetical protein EUX98_g1692 [Antrodiella citrinella]|uniref:Uncharacterized protein n=1 Tax=Antrodiella citrinella TaxID=2447956 RepID=A0A4S4N3V7_9APHY|nr:hypothetical protein EUX98_g1692 [Antrodiella citrinella]
MDEAFEYMEQQLPKPESPNFYTGRSAYFDQTNMLEDAISHTRKALTSLHLLPLPKFALDSLPPLQPVWKPQIAMGQAIGMKLKTSRYRKLTDMLNQLDQYKRIALTAGYAELAEMIDQVLVLFERANKEAVLMRGRRKPVKFDEYGRSYTLGKRKESAARVWMIPVKHDPLPKIESLITAVESEPSELEALKQANPDLAAVAIPTAPPAESTRPGNLPVTNILINNVPIIKYFPKTSDRERIVRPFKIAGLLGAYNVFALVRGGGTSGQSGAVAHGIAKGLAGHVPEVSEVLRKAKLLRRDPRMVERKKTGLLKARKARTWVRR